MSVFERPKAFVGGEGPLIGCKVCLIGEAPGSNENLLGRPFVGAAGELLNTLLSNAEVNRSECYLTNVVKEQPPGNDITTFIDLKKAHAVVTPRYEEYERILYEELRPCTANVYIPLGNISLYALTRLRGITKRRGSLLCATQLDRRKCIPTLHPASALRQYLNRYFILHDLRRAKKESITPDLTLPERQLHIGPTYYEVLDFLALCKTVPEVAFDIEVLNEEVSCISFAPTPSRCMCITFIGPKGDWFDPDQECSVWRMIADILGDPKIRKVGQNLNFDTTFLYIKFGIRTRNVADTMVGHKILYPDFPMGLDFICSTYTNEPYYKDEGKKWFKMVGGSHESFWLYNAKDSAVCSEAIAGIEADLVQTSNYATYQRQLTLLEPLTFMQAHGIRVDTEGLAQARTEAQKRIDTMRADFERLCPSVNPASAKQLKDYFYGVLRLPAYHDRKTGQPTVDQNALKRLSRKGIQAAALLLELRKLSKLQSTYFNMKLDADSRLRCSYNPVGTNSGRLSSSKTIFGTGGNMQNLPPSMKRFLIADDNYVTYKVDLSQAENRAVAYFAPEPTMIQAFESGIDIHCQTAGLIFNKPAYEVSKEDGSCSIGGGIYSERYWGKKANHALNYDLGYKKFAFINEIPEQEARILVERYHTVYPGVRQYHAWVRAQLQQDRTLTTPYGRRRTFMDRWDDELFKAAYAFTPQSTIADHLNIHGLSFLYYNKTISTYVELLNQVHDSVEFQISLDVPWFDHARILLTLKHSLQTPIQWRTSQFSIPADCKIGLNLKDGEVVDWFRFNTIETLSAELARLYICLTEPKETSILDTSTDDDALEDSVEEVGSAIQE